MTKERYFIINDMADACKVNNFLAELEENEIEYETDYDTETKNGILVIVNF